LLDNAGLARADRVLPEYEHLQVGGWMPMANKDHRHDRVQGDGVRDQSLAPVAETGQYTLLVGERLVEREGLVVLILAHAYLAQCR